MLPVGALSSSFGDGGKLPSPCSMMTLVAFPTLYSSALSSVHPCWFARWALEGEAVTSPQRANVRMPDAGLMIGKGRYTFNHLCECSLTRYHLTRGPDVDSPLLSATPPMAEAEAERKEQRRRNGNASRERPSDAQLKQRDSSLKRNNAMSRKLRSITSTSKQQIEEELPKLNLSKYLDEAVSSIAEGRLKPSDLPAAVSICSTLHLTYPSFASLLAPQLAKLATGGSALDSGEPLPASQRKVKLRFLAELALVHVVHDASLLVNAVKDVCSAHVEPSGAGTGGGAISLSPPLLASTVLPT